MDRAIKVILKPLKRFAIQKPNASLLLFGATIVAMILANSPWSESYHRLLAFPIDFHVGGFDFFAHHGEPMSMLAFVNDALMAVFFFTIGLEIKQEVLIGELSWRVKLVPEGIVADCRRLRWYDRPGFVLSFGLWRKPRGEWRGNPDGDGHRVRPGGAGPVGQAGSAEYAYLPDCLGGGR